MLEALYVTLFSVGLLALWAVLASPAIVGFILVLRLMRRGRIRIAYGAVPLAIAFAVLAAPVPTPIITFLFPHGLALLDGAYYRYILAGPFISLWWWIVPSLTATFCLSLAVAVRYGRPLIPGPSSSSSRGGG